MNVSALMGWMQIAQVAIPLGLATAQQVEGWIRGSKGTMTDAEMNAVVALVLDDASRRKALAIADALGT